MTPTTCGRAILVAVALFVAAALAACRAPTPEEIDSETPVTVSLAPATRGTIRGAIHATGVVTPAPDAELVVIAPETARIAEIPRAAGDRVREGDVLVRFEIPSSTADVERQQADVTRAAATLDAARAAETRARDLFDRGVAARRDVEDATRAMADAGAALAQARASLAAAQAVAARMTVRATFDGVVTRRLHNPGDLVEAAAADPVLRVVDPRRLEVVAAVPLADAPRVEVGAAARVVEGIATPQVLGLTVVSRPAAVDAGTATVPVRLRVVGSTNLPVGTPVQVAIDAEQHRDVVLVPASAIVREGDEVAVFVARDKKAQRRVVQIGLTDGTQVEVRSGVAAGDLVIVDGQAGLPDAAAIAVGSQDGAPGKAGAGATEQGEPK
jgi:RND family efflux transporter MFP subunit